MNNWDNIHKRELLILTLAFVMPLLVLGLILVNESDVKNKKLAELKEKEIKTYSFSPNIKAKSAMVTELNTGKILYALNEKEQRPIASLTKIITALVAAEKLESKNTKEIEINENHLTAFGDSGLIVGQKWKVKDLIDFTLITSSNDGARALAFSAFDKKEDNFITEMNSFSKRLGLANTFFANETGLDINMDNQAGAISSAEDITKILRFINSNSLSLFESSTDQQKEIFIGDVVYEAKNTNQSIEKIPGALVSKTGYTDIAGGNLAIVLDFGLNNPISIVVLGSTLEDRENDVLELLDETAQYYLNNLKN